MRALLMPVGVDWYAIAMSSVREVVPQPQLTAVPTAPAAVLGLFNLRGEVVPLFDTAALLSFGSTPRWTHCAVVLTALGPAGIVATGAPEAAELGEPVSTAEHVAGIGCYAADNRLVTLLDLDPLFGTDQREVGSP